jgi:hypothetical protein
MLQTTVFIHRTWYPLYCSIICSCCIEYRYPFLCSCIPRKTPFVYRTGRVRNDVKLFCLYAPPPPGKSLLYFRLIVKAISQATTSSSRLQGVTKRCRLSWLTNNTLVFEPKGGGRGGGVAGSQPLNRYT